jgi:clan AA aspartic protease
MGLTYVTVRIENLTRTGEPYEKEFLVDTGAIDCLAPATALNKAGIAVEGRDVYELANGDVLEYPYGFARVSFMGSETVAQIIFGPENAQPILGVAALENTGIGIDPVSRTLERMAAKPQNKHLKIILLPKVPRSESSARSAIWHGSASTEIEYLPPGSRQRRRRLRQRLKPCQPDRIELAVGQQWHESPGQDGLGGPLAQQRLGRRL